MLFRTSNYEILWLFTHWSASWISSCLVGNDHHDLLALAEVQHWVILRPILKISWKCTHSETPPYSRVTSLDVWMRRHINCVLSRLTRIPFCSHHGENLTQAEAAEQTLNLAMKNDVRGKAFYRVLMRSQSSALRKRNARNRTPCQHACRSTLGDGKMKSQGVLQRAWWVEEKPISVICWLGWQLCSRSSAVRSSSIWSKPLPKIMHGCWRDGTVQCRASWSILSWRIYFVFEAHDDSMSGEYCNSDVLSRT